MTRGRIMRCAGAAAMLALSAATAAAPLRNAYSDRLQKLSDIQRKAALRSALLDNGVTCRRVETAAPRAAYKNLAMWKVTCTKGYSYGAFIGPDGTVQVRPCADLPKLRLPRCG